MKITMISILEKNRAPSGIEFREGPWCEQLLGSLQVVELVTKRS